MKHILKLIASFTLMLVLLLGASLMTNSITARADDDEEEESYSFYAIATNAALYYSNALKPDKDGKIPSLNAAMAQNQKTNTVETSTIPGNAGAFVAYGEQSWFMSALTSASSAYAYSIYGTTGIGIAIDRNGATTDAMSQYCRYGYLLGSLGLDHATTEMSVSVWTLFSGGLMIMAYGLSMAVPVFFKLLIQFLQWVNPFTLFGLASSTNIKNYIGTTNGGMFSGLATIVSKFYNALDTFSWQIVVPMFFVGLVVSIVLMKTTKNANGSISGKIKKYVIRIFFIVMGIPLLGGTYTSILDSMKEQLSAKETVATKVVASTFVDFGEWSYKYRLAVPQNAVIEYSESKTADTGTSGSSSVGIYATAKSKMMLRANCWYINQLSHGDSIFNGSSSYDIPTGSDDEIVQKVASTSYDLTNNTSGSDNTVSTVWAMLGRYASGSFYYGSDYESDAKGQLVSSKNSSNADTQKAINIMMNTASVAKGWKIDSEGKADVSDVGDIKKADVETAFLTRFTDTTAFMGHNIFANGGLYIKSYNDGTNTFGDKYYNKDPLDSDSSAVSEIGGLSTFSMYNYLNTSFNSDGMVVYSSEKASSGFVKKGHKAVSLIGSGFDSILYWLSAVILMICFTIVGLWYCGGILVANVRRGLHLIMSVPFAMLGSIQAIAKVVTYTVMLIVEILGSIFLFTLVEELLVDIPQVLVGPMAKAMQSNSAIASLMSSLYVPIMLVFEIVLYVIFTIESLRVRKKFVRTVDEMAAKTIDKFFVDDKNGGGSGAMAALGKKPDGPGLARKVAGGAAGAVGMAAGAKMMGAFGNDKKDGAKGLSAGDSASKQTDGVRTDADGSNGSGGMNVDSDGNPVDPSTSGNAIATKSVGGIEAKSQKGLPGPISQMQQDEAVANGVGDSIATNVNADGEQQTMGVDGDTSKLNAVNEEKANEAVMAETKSNKDAAKQEAVDGAVNTAVGAAKVAAGADSGDAKMALDGAKDIKNGTDEMKQAKDDASNAKSDAQSSVASQVNGQAGANTQETDKDSSGGKSPVATNDVSTQSHESISQQGDNKQETANIAVTNDMKSTSDDKSVNNNSNVDKAKTDVSQKNVDGSQVLNHDTDASKTETATKAFNKGPAFTQNVGGTSSQTNAVSRTDGAKVQNTDASTQRQQSTQKSNANNNNSVHASSSVTAVSHEKSSGKVKSMNAGANVGAHYGNDKGSSAGRNNVPQSTGSAQRNNSTKAGFTAGANVGMNSGQFKNNSTTVVQKQSTVSYTAGQNGGKGAGNGGVTNITNNHTSNTTSHHKSSMKQMNMSANMHMQQNHVSNKNVSNVTNRHDSKSTINHVVDSGLKKAKLPDKTK